MVAAYLGHTAVVDALLAGGADASLVTLKVGWDSWDCPKYPVTALDTL